MNRYVPDVETDIPTSSMPDCHKILDDLVLRIKHHRLTAGQFRKIETVCPAIEAQVNSFMPETLLCHAFASTDFAHQVYRALLQDTGPDGGLDGIAASRFQDNGFNSRKVQ
jgi:hypothetical protein